MPGFLSLIILLSLSFAGFLFPEYFKGLKDLIVPLLAFIMLSMGITLTPEDFKRILKQPFIVFYGALLQFTVMPLSSYLISLLLVKDINLLTGMVLVGSAPGGTASNLITFLSRGDVAYSISMTTVSTLLSPILTPLWTFILAGRYVEVPFLSMVMTTSKIILIPSLNRDLLLKPIFPVYLGILLHITTGFSAGFLAGKFLKLDVKKTKALSIEVGMQNSGLAVVLAIKHFSSIASIPPALFSLAQNILGLFLSFILKKKI